MPRDAASQKDHFDSARNQYSLDALTDPPLHTRIEEQRVLVEIAGLPLDARILDFGAGTGRLSLALARAGRQVIAMDISEDSLEKLERVGDRMGLRGITITTSLPVEPVDAIVGADVFHHVPLAEILPELYGALKPGGILAFSEPGGFHPFWYAYHTARRSMWIERRNLTMNKWWLPKQLHEAGFREVRLRGVGLLPRPVANFSERAVKLNDDIGSLPGLSWMAYRYLITARR